MTNDEFIRQIFDELLTNLHSKIRQNSSKLVRVRQNSSLIVKSSSKFVKIRQDFVKIRQKIRHEIGFYSDE